MSWRKFATLLRGLGPTSATFSRAQIRRLEENKKGRVTTITNREQANSVFDTLFRPPEKH